MADALELTLARDLARGPARLCQALAVTRAQNGADFCDPASPLRLLPGHRASRTLVDGTAGTASPSRRCRNGHRR